MKLTQPNDFAVVKQKTARDEIQAVPPMPVLDVKTPILIPASNIVAWEQGVIFYQDITTNKTYTFSTLTDGQTILIRLYNSTAGELTIIWPAFVKGAELNIPAATYKLFSFTKIGAIVFATQVEML